MSRRDDLENTIEDFKAEDDDFKGVKEEYEGAVTAYDNADSDYQSTVDEVESKAHDDPDYTEGEHNADKATLDAAYGKYQDAYGDYKAATDKYNGKYEDYRSDYADYKAAAQELLRIDLAALSDAIQKVRAQSFLIHIEMMSINATMESVSEDWKGPAFNTYDPVQQWFRRTQEALFHLLGEILRRMEVAHANYKDAEQKNFQNVTPSGDGPTAAA